MEIITILRILILFNYSSYTVESAAPLAGPFNAILKRCGPCPAEYTGKNLYQFTLKIKRHTRAYSVIHANMSLAIPLNKEITGLVTLAVMTSQGWKDNFFSLDIGPVCEGLKKYLPSLYTNAMSQLGVKGCPIPAGNYTNVELDMNMTVGGLTVMFYNDYRGRVYAKKNGIVISCGEFYGSITPKKTG